MLRSSTTYLAGLAVGSVLVAAYEALAFWQDVEATSAVAAMWPAVFLLLLVLWIIEDSKAFPAIQKPFDYDFLVFMLALPYLPYYLWRTRRWHGLLMLAGFVALYGLGYFAQLVMYAAGPFNSHG